MTAPMSRAEITKLPPVIDLPTLGRVLGVSEPVIRERARLGELEPLGIKVVKLGAQRKAITSSVWAFLGIDGDADCASSEAQSLRPARQGKATASVLRSASGDEAG